MQKTSWTGRFIGIGISLIILSCVQTEKAPVKLTLPREPASLHSEVPKLVYITYYKNGKVNREEIHPTRWRGENNTFSAGGREDYLLKMYYANSREASLTNLRHAACFYGHANDVTEQFFRDGTHTIDVRNLKSLEHKASTDGHMLGIKFNHHDKGELTFRLAHCDSGKSSISDSFSSSWTESSDSKKVSTYQVPKRKIASTKGEYGFEILDNPTFDESKMPRFKLRADFQNAPNRSGPKPWAGLDLSDPKQALKFTLLVQKYFYENMANQNPKNNDFNFIAQNNKNRFWCHMPWQHVGVVGREAVHGMTKERDLAPSPFMPNFKNATPGTNWGIAYYNDDACHAIENVFGNSSNPRIEPDFTKSNFDDGSVIIKMLFTTANFPEIKNAFAWNGSVSDVGATERKIQPVRHIQMDIAVKDYSLKGTNKNVNSWVMAAFYYDENYSFDMDLKQQLGEENPLKSLPNIPKALFKMRPMGIQTGYDSPSKGETIIFPGAFANGSGGRLNGPADNPKASCLGCHGAAGTGASKVPGFLSMAMFAPYQSVGYVLDFSQQFSLAKENFETEMSK